MRAVDPRRIQAPHARLAGAGGAHPRVGRGTRLRARRHRGPRRRACRRPARRLARRRTPWRDGVPAAARRDPARRDAPAARRAARDRGADGLPAARHAAGLARARAGAKHGLARSDHLDLRARPRLPQGAAPAAAGARVAHRRRGRGIRLSRRDGFRAGAGSRTRAQGRARLARQAHAAAVAGGGLDLLPRRDPHRPAVAGRCTDDRALRNLHTLHRRVPDAGDHRAVSARCAPLHLVPDDRTAGRDSRGTAAVDRQSRLRLRRLPARVSVEQVRAHCASCRTSTCGTGWTARRWSNSLRGPKTEFNERHAGSAIRRIGYARWLRNIAVGLGNADSSPEVIAALRAAPTIRTRSSASMSRGRSRATPRTRAARRSATAAASPSQPVSAS